MKMSPQRYNELKEGIRQVVDHFGPQKIKEQYELAPKRMIWDLLRILIRNWGYDDTHPAFAEGVWKRIIPYKGIDYSTYYNEGLNDSHLTTALNKIVRELGLRD